jgi:hypothetical protein
MRKSKAETIAYALKKECQRISLYDWCDSWDITTDEFDEFLALAVGNAEVEDEKQIPMKPIFNHNLSDTLSVFHCECGNTIKVSHDVGIMNNNNAPNYCSKCGCRLDWSDDDEID